MCRVLKSILCTEMLPTRTNGKRHSEKKRKEGFDSQTCWLRKQTEKPAAVDVSYIFMTREGQLGGLNWEPAGRARDRGQPLKAAGPGSLPPWPATSPY